MGSILLVALCSSTIVACLDLRSVAGAEAQTRVQVSDSAGVRNISLGRFEELSAPELTADLVFSTRALGVELYRVGDALLLANGGLALANTGDSRIMLFSEDGSLEGRVGGAGRGPGEFGTITTLLTADAGFLAYDTRLGRLSRFSETGEFLTSSRLSAQSATVELRPLARDDAGNMLAILGVQRSFQPSGMKRDTTPPAVVHGSRDRPGHARTAPRPGMGVRQQPRSGGAHSSGNGVRAGHRRRCTGGSGPHRQHRRAEPVGLRCRRQSEAAHPRHGRGLDGHGRGHRDIKSGTACPQGGPPGLVCGVRRESPLAGDAPGLPLCGPWTRRNGVDRARHTPRRRDQTLARHRPRRSTTGMVGSSRRRERAGHR